MAKWPPVACLLVLLQLAGTAHAKDDEMLAIWQWLELATPDSSLDYGDGHDGVDWVFGWPIPVTLPRLPLFWKSESLHYTGAYPKNSSEWLRCDHYKFYVIPSFYVEPQVRVAPGDWRIAGGARADLRMADNIFHIRTEGFGVAGQDGNGGGFGLGIGVRGGLTIGYRGTFLHNDDYRQSITFDFTFFSIPLGKNMSEHHHRGYNRCEETSVPVNTPDDAS